ncbi:MAG: type IV pilus biogenesis/stability protein PilW [Pseudomonadota bacterium]
MRSGQQYFFNIQAVLRTAQFAILLMSPLLLVSCVTETTGGFNAERSDSVALENYIQAATVYLEQGDLANTKRHLGNASSIDGNNSDIYAIWALVYSREGEAKLAEENFEHSLRINPDNSKARNNYAAFLFANNRLEDAYDQLERVVQDVEYPNRSQAFENLGFAALRLNRPVDAEAAFGRALQLNDQQIRSSLELADLNLKKNDVLQARAFYRNYLALQQFYRVAHNARSLWIGIQLENALGNSDNITEYGEQLETNFSASDENQLYQQLLETLTDE